MAPKSAAGEDWLSSFFSQKNVLSIRRPFVINTRTCLARATSFKATTINSFFEKLSAVIYRHAFQASDIYNINETGVTSVQRPMETVGTVELMVNACGNTGK